MKNAETNDRPDDGSKQKVLPDHETSKIKFSRNRNQDIQGQQFSMSPKKQLNNTSLNNISKPPQTSNFSPKKQPELTFTNVQKPLQTNTTSPKKQVEQHVTNDQKASQTDISSSTKQSDLLFSNVQKSSQTDAMSPKKHLDNFSTNIPKSFQTNNYSPKKHYDSPTKPAKTNSMSPKKQTGSFLPAGQKSFQQSPVKGIPVYKPAAEDKIQTDIVNAIVARDTEASMKKEPAVQMTNEISVEQAESCTSNRKFQSSPKKQLSKNMARRQSINKKEDAYKAKSPKRKLDRIHKKSYELMSLDNQLQRNSSVDESNNTDQVRNTSPLSNVGQSKSKQTDNKKFSVDLKELKGTNPASLNTDTMKDKIISPALNATYTKEINPRKTVKPPGPLIKRSPFKNNPKFNKKQRDTTKTDKSLKVEGKKQL